MLQNIKLSNPIEGMLVGGGENRRLRFPLDSEDDGDTTSSIILQSNSADYCVAFRVSVCYTLKSFDNVANHTHNT